MFSSKMNPLAHVYILGEWEIVPGSGPGKQLGPDEAEWRWNSLTQNWERTVVTGGSGAASGNICRTISHRLKLYGVKYN